jgi:hypothetical protein
MGCNAKWPEEELGIVHLKSNPSNQRHTFFHVMAHCPMLAHCAKGGIWDNYQVNGEWNYGNLP